jgi:hypothetical protein
MDKKFDQSNNYRITKAVPSDIKSMLELNYKIYPAEWHVTEDYVKKIMKKNPEVYNVLNTELGTKGIFSLFPLTKETYESILQGDLEETDLSGKVLDYSKEKEVYLYLISIIVDIHDSDRKKYAKQIIQSIPFELKRLVTKGIKIKEIGAIAISPEGEKILPRIGFRKDNKIHSVHNKNFPVFRASVEDVITSIHI